MCTYNEARTVIEHTLHGLSDCAYRSFGAHFTQEYNQNGVRFTVYAPNAKKVELIGSFNDWTGYPMFSDAQGVWSIFAEDIPEHSLYKYRITTASGECYDRIDPFAFASECRPDTASVVYSLNGFDWQDSAWMQLRNKNFTRPLNIYEVHLGSWNNISSEKNASYLELIHTLIPYVKEMGYTHIEFLPLTEHPLDASWGYQTTGYFSATSRYGSPKELMALINACHCNNLGVILDFVPLHFVSDFYALHQYDGSYLYENSTQPYSEWGTVLFDYAKPYVLSFMHSALEFWISHFHIDGIRYDAVSRLIYTHGDSESELNESGIWFLKSVNYALQQKHPDVMLIAEDSSNYPKATAPVEYGGLGFDYKWSLGWMHDTLDYLSLPPAERSSSHHRLTFAMNYFYNEKYLLPFSHDEVVHGKKSMIQKIYGNKNEQFAQLRLLSLFMMTHPGKKLNFMGNELAQKSEWNEATSCDWDLLTLSEHKAFHYYEKMLHRYYCDTPALYEVDYHFNKGFSWIDANNSSSSLFAYYRENMQGQRCYVVCNFSNLFLSNYHLRVAKNGTYQVSFFTDEKEYGGSGLQQTPLLSSSLHLSITLPPFSGIVIEALT